MPGKYKQYLDRCDNRGSPNKTVYVIAKSNTKKQSYLPKSDTLKQRYWVLFFQLLECLNI